MLNDKVTAIELMPGQFYLDFFHSLKWNVVSALFKDFHPGYFPRSFVGLVNDSSAQLQGDSVIWINLCSHITFNIIMIRFSSRYPEMLKNFEPRQRRNLRGETWKSGLLRLNYKFNANIRRTKTYHIPN